MSSNEANHTNSGATWQGPLNGVNGIPIQQQQSSQPPFTTTQPTPRQQPMHTASPEPNTPGDHSLGYGASAPLPLFPIEYPAEDTDANLSNVQQMQEEDFDLPGSVEPPVSRMEIFAQIGQYVSLVLAPLLFAGLTCLFVLPLVANGRAKIPPEGLWPLTLVIVAVAIAQGVAVYYSGSNNVFWAMSTIGAFFLFLLVGCYAIFGVVPTFFLLAAFIVLTIVLARLYVRQVPQGTVDMVYLFGKYSRTLDPGFNILLPWEKIHNKGIKVTERTWTSPLLRVQMSRTEDVEISATMSYQLIPEQAHIAITQVDAWEANLRELFKTTIKNVATSISPDDLLAWQRGLRSRLAPSGALNSPFENSPRWEQINNTLFQYMRDKAIQRGIQVNWAQVSNAKLMPHGATTLESTSEARPSNAATTQPDSGMAGKQSRASSPSSPSTATPAVDLPQISNEMLESVLMKAYREVRNGKITDPSTIRHLAQQFEAVARDPEKNKHVSFDAKRAAQNLYEEAQNLFVEAQRTELPANNIYNDETKPDWNLRKPSDENTHLGG